jgi:hypothetical protein
LDLEIGFVFSHLKTHIIVIIHFYISTYVNFALSKIGFVFSNMVVATEAILIPFEVGPFDCAQSLP